MKSRYPAIEFDKLQMYFGTPYVIDVEGTEGTITIYQPTIGDIINIGEKKFYSSLNLFITNTTSYRLVLWEMGIDWNEFSDFDLFIMLFQAADPDVVKMIFGDIDLNKFKAYEKQLEDRTCKVLYDPENNLEIDENVYFHISQYLRNVFNIFPEEKLTKSNVMKNWFIERDKRQAEIDKRKQEKGEIKDSSMMTVISSCINHPGFKYNLKELKNVGVCQFYDSVKRLQIYESTTALMKGMYSGMIDGSKLKADDYNFMKEI